MWLSYIFGYFLLTSLRNIEMTSWNELYDLIIYIFLTFKIRCCKEFRNHLKRFSFLNTWHKYQTSTETMKLLCKYIFRRTYFGRIEHLLRYHSAAYFLYVWAWFHYSELRGSNTNLLFQSWQTTCWFLELEYKSMQAGSSYESCSVLQKLS